MGGHEDEKTICIQLDANRGEGSEKFHICFVNRGGKQSDLELIRRKLKKIGRTFVMRGMKFMLMFIYNAHFQEFSNDAAMCSPLQQFRNDNFRSDLRRRTIP